MLRLQFFLLGLALLCFAGAAFLESVAEGSFL
jgi:hypothetical protein